MVMTAWCITHNFNQQHTPWESIVDSARVRGALRTGLCSKYLQHQILTSNISLLLFFLDGYDLNCRYSWLFCSVWLKGHPIVNVTKTNSENPWISVASAQWLQSIMLVCLSCHDDSAKYLSNNCQHLHHCWNSLIPRQNKLSVIHFPCNISMYVWWKAITN